MHCDDKRMLYVYKEDIEKTWNKLKDSDFQDEELLKNLNQTIKEYFEFKSSFNEK